KVARGLLPEAVPHQEAAVQVANAGVIVAALARGQEHELDAELAFAGTQDCLHQAYRQPAMPTSRALLAHLRDRRSADALSGAGPTVAALVRPGDGAGVAALAPEGFAATLLRVDREGATVCRLAPAAPDGGQADAYLVRPGDAGERAGDAAGRTVAAT